MSGQSSPAAPVETQAAAEEAPLSPLRFLFLGESVVSDWENPAATTTRAILRALRELGHHAIFLEERGNRAIVALLRARGAEALRSFSTQCPDIVYRTYELARGTERTVWLGQQLSASDVVVVQDTAPPAVFEEIARFAGSHVVRACQLTESGTPPFEADFVLAPVGSDSGIPFGPAVYVPTPNSNPTVGREGVIVAAYDDARLAETVAQELRSLPAPPALVSPGNLMAPHWISVPEIALSAAYARCQAAVIIGAGARSLAAARLLLPLSAGCPTFAVGPIPLREELLGTGVVGVTADTILEAVTRLMTDGGSSTKPAEIPGSFDASVQADRLASLAREVMRQRRTAKRGR